MNTTLNAIRAHGPCADGWAKLLRGLGKTQADDEPLDMCRILDINGLDDALWCLRVLPADEQWRSRMMAFCSCLPVLGLMKDERSRNSVVVVGKHSCGEASDGELAAARDAARAAAWDAARAAAWDAAWAAAWDAARAAGWDAVRAAGWDAARAAARAAAWDAARAAAWDAHALMFREIMARETRPDWSELEPMWVAALEEARTTP